MKKVLLMITLILSTVCLIACSDKKIYKQSELNIDNANVKLKGLKEKKQSIIYANQISYKNYELEDNNIFSEAANVAIATEMIDNNINDIIAGKGFIIYDVDNEEDNIWYFPVYYNNEIITTIKIILLIVYHMEKQKELTHLNLTMK